MREIIRKNTELKGDNHSQQPGSSPSQIDIQCWAGGQVVSIQINLVAPECSVEGGMSSKVVHFGRPNSNRDYSTCTLGGHALR